MLYTGMECAHGLNVEYWPLNLRQSWAILFSWQIFRRSTVSDVSYSRRHKNGDISVPFHSTWTETGIISVHLEIVNSVNWNVNWTEMEQLALGTELCTSKCAHMWLLQQDGTLSFSSSQFYGAASSDGQPLKRWSSRRNLLWYSNGRQHPAISSSRHWASQAVSSLKQWTASWVVGGTFIDTWTIIIMQHL